MINNNYYLNIGTVVIVEKLSIKMVKIKNEAKKVSIESIDVDGFSFLMYL